MASQNSQYLESKVLTAPPHRLHLMLIEGALRFGRQADEAMQRGDTVAASAPLLRVIDIVGEMVAAVRENKGDLNDKLAALYWFVFRRVTEAKIHGDLTALADALHILEYERQTWQMVCEKFADAAKPNGEQKGVAATPHSAKSSLSLEA